MAERSVRDGLSRRSSLRQTRAEGELPPEFLDTLEQKRKQLDESIHKYIASKEREYKLFEKDIRAQCKSDRASERQDTVAESTDSRPKEHVSSGGGQDAKTSPSLKAQRQGMSAVDALLSNGTKRDIDSHAISESKSLALAEYRAKGAGLTSREKDLNGLFTPQYLPAIDLQNGKDVPRLERAESAPPAIELSGRNEESLSDGLLLRAESDTAVASSPKMKRPMHLHLAQRTSSSGSSADGRLASAMKSPTHALRRPKRKRVSLAVGDSIVAPSEDVPLSFSNNKTPSHSRTRSTVNKPDLGPEVAQQKSTSSNSDIETLTTYTKPSENPESDIDSGANPSIQRTDMQPALEANRMPTVDSTLQVPTTSPKPSIDPDGDLFDLEEEEAGLPSPHDTDDSENALESGDDVTVGDPEHHELHASPLDSRNNPNVEYDPETGVLPEPAPVAPKPVDENNTAMHLEFGPKAASASQQPTKPGFRRPSVAADPVFNGNNYKDAEAKVVEHEIYGSSFIRPPSKGSFTGGSLGESYMAKHAEKMMELRIATKREQEVPT